MPALLGFGYLVAGIIVAISILSSAIKIVREYQRLVVFRLGRSIGKQGPGVVFLLPVIDRTVWVDLREFFLEIPSQTCITKDNAPINIDFLIYFKVFDPDLSVIQVIEFACPGRGRRAFSRRKATVRPPSCGPRASHWRWTRSSA